MREYLLSNLRCGVSTGASAAAAAKAAALYLLRGKKKGKVSVLNPAGLSIEVPVKEVSGDGESARAVVIKDGGDDPDVTNGLEIIVEVCAQPGNITLHGGPGVGTVTRPGLAVSIGEPAINPVPRQMIMDAVAGLAPPGSGLRITVTVPHGEQVAKRTLNPRLGILGGISILGTTGIVRPMSEEAYKKSLEPQIDVALAAGHKKLILTPGRMGARLAIEIHGFAEEAVVEMSNFVGYMLDACVARKIEAVLLWGHHGKLVKVAGGNFHTHNKTSDGRMETIAAYAGLAGASQTVLQDIMSAATAEEAWEVLSSNNLQEVYNTIAARASFRAGHYAGDSIKVGTVLLGLDGTILGLDRAALDIGREIGWPVLMSSV